jgi:ribosomal-protein-alanine N-acetyltransferase
MPDQDTYIAEMCAADIQDVLAIERECFADPWSEQAFQEEIKNNLARCLVLKKLSGELIGYAIYWIVVDEIHLMNIAVRSDQRRKGFGTKLMSLILRDVRLKNIKYVSLEVRRSNMAAQALYRILGFREAGVRESYYKNGEDAILMSVEISN